MNEALALLALVNANNIIPIKICRAFKDLRDSRAFLVLHLLSSTIENCILVHYYLYVSTFSREDTSLWLLSANRGAGD